ncbi:50S ribosomal protein L2 [Candidatus Micrarchaeota archaeon]|nr:50S ribosomal protein L2 [Candidatus Micrarchaeota archaeon]MBU1165956.1 50S ribosomal protein L2 [Candidatus Micrarchaeota archaeon]MBU1886860.1 50S ribosomal protein L2 [Candidatus Micrarchaeota archaeon]
MGKRLKQQKRGAGSPRYKSPGHRYKTNLSYRDYDDIEKTGVLTGKVVGFIDDPARTALLMKVKYDNGETAILIAPEGIAIGDVVDAGVQGRLVLGSVLPLYRIPDGAYIFNVERNPGDGGTMVKAAGSYANVIAKEGNIVYLKLPSKTTIKLSNESRAQLGIISGGGALEKPMLKAGNQFYKMRGKHRLWPVPRGVHQAAYNHPHGGKQHHVGKPTTVARGAPPGSKVGHIAARSTGRRKGKRTAEPSKSSKSKSK